MAGGGSSDTVLVAACGLNLLATKACCVCPGWGLSFFAEGTKMTRKITMGEKPKIKPSTPQSINDLLLSVCGVDCRVKRCCNWLSMVVYLSVGPDISKVRVDDARLLTLIPIVPTMGLFL